MGQDVVRAPITLSHRSSPQAIVAERGWPEEEIIVFEGILDPDLSEPTDLWPQERDQTPVKGANSPTIDTSPYLYYTESVSPTPSGNFGGDMFFTPLGSSGTPSLDGDGEILVDIPSPRGCETPPMSASFVPVSLAEPLGTDKNPLSMGVGVEIPPVEPVGSRTPSPPRGLRGVRTPPPYLEAFCV